MKRISTVLTLAFLLCVTTTFAQVNFGVKAGVNLATMSISGEDTDEINDLKKLLLTFQVGGVADINLTDNLAVQPSLMLVGKGLKLEDDEFDAKTILNPIYLQVPVLLLYKGNMFYVGAGPYVALGLFGKSKIELGGEEESEDIAFGNGEDDDLAPLDFGATAEAGVMLPLGIRIGAGYSLGLANIVPKDARGDEDFSFKNGVISVNVAYMFGSND